MARRRCPFCHEMISGLQYDRHIRQHTELRADGQMNDHVTLPPDQRHGGSIDDVPSVYEHDRCGKCTRMPDDIIRSYLRNPFLYNDKTFCASCGTYYHTREFTWVETGETLYEYNQNLKAEYRKRHPTLLTQLLRVIAGLFQGPPQKKSRRRKEVEDIDDYLESPKLSVQRKRRKP